MNNSYVVKPEHESIENISDLLKLILIQSPILFYFLFSLKRIPSNVIILNNISFVPISCS